MAISHKEKFLERDRMVRVITDEGDFRAIIVKATDLSNAAIKKHQLNPLAGMILSELMVGSLLATISLKGEERIQLRLDVDGPLQSAVAESNAIGEVRGYPGNRELIPEATDPVEIKKRAIGTGILRVTKTLKSRSHPVQSSVELTESVIAKDLARYFALSEQVPTAVQIGVRLNQDYTIRSAMGLLLQALPGAQEESIVKLEINLIDHPDLGSLFEEEHDLDAVLGHFLQGRQWRELSTTPVHFFCRCSKKRFINGLRLLPRGDLEDMSGRDQELVCQYCNSKYIVTKNELQKLLADRGG